MKHDPLKLTYRGAASSEQEAAAMCDSFINGGVYQEIDGVWHVWQT
jgi:hypothetical protein